MSRARENRETRETTPEPDIPALVRGDLNYLIVTTSGSTGGSRRVRLSRAALLASANATLDRLGGPGNWLLCLATTHIAGIQVLVRAAIGGGRVVRQNLDERFAAPHFAAATAELGPGRRYTSIVPTQLARLVADPDGLAALTTFDAVLVGAAATSPDLLTQARASGVNVVTTYGMTETCGGCVYDGRPLDGVEVSLADDGRIRIRGAVLADGYLTERLDPASATEPETIDTELTGKHLTADGLWVTNDVGVIEDGLLRVTGRADRVINTGGIKVDPDTVAQAITCYLGDGQTCHVIGIPDPEWGEQVVAIVTPPTGEDQKAPPVRWNTDKTVELRRFVAQELGRAAAPADVFSMVDLPRSALGKIDHVALVQTIRDARNR